MMTRRSKGVDGCREREGSRSTAMMSMDRWMMEQEQEEHLPDPFPSSTISYSPLLYSSRRRDKMMYSGTNALLVSGTKRHLSLNNASLSRFKVGW
jgi:hypothetical protein